MNDIYNKQSVASSLLWKFFERGGSQGIQLIIQLILARILAPKEFGTLSLILVFVDIAQVFVQSGFNTALIQKKNTNETDFSSVFIVNLVISFALYLLIFLLSPFIANFYKITELVAPLRVVALILFPGALNSVQNAYVSKKMHFKILFKCSLISTILSGIMGILGAYMGLGVWSLVLQQLSYHCINSVLLWINIDWHPRKKFSYESISELFSFGSGVLISNLVYRLYLNLRTLVIGRVYSPSALAYYQRGEQVPKVLVNNIDGSIQSVMLPTLSAVQDENERLKNRVKQTVKLSSYLIFPMMVGLFVVSEKVIIVLLTEKWLAAVPFLKIFSITYAFWPIITINLQPIRALGKSKLLIKLELLKRFIGLAIIIGTIPFGVQWVAVGALIERLVEVFINAYPNGKLINYPIYEQIKDISPSILLSLLMGLAIFPIGFLSLSNFWLLSLQIILGLLIYIILSLITKNKSLAYIFNLIKSFLK